MPRPNLLLGAWILVFLIAWGRIEAFEKFGMMADVRECGVFRLLVPLGAMHILNESEQGF